MSFSTGGGDLQPSRQYKVTRYNQRMAGRIARRAHLNEQGIAVAFAFNNLFTLCVFGLIEDFAKFVPYFGDLLEIAISLVSFWFHRIVLVTDQNVYIYRDLPFHWPHRQLAVYSRGEGVVSIGSQTPHSGISRFIRRGQLNFHDGQVVYHSIIWIRRARYIVQEGNLPAGS